ncbi:Auxin response factor 5 [Clarias magur]|uniref:Auxin response factor 5 n=1 Tax=Clarias magur TaxID=1594786 RepID=A0A8J4XEN6_CLAMG|nr:Auxin response factor 5 [Clarias magur]
MFTYAINNVCWTRGKSSKHLSPPLTQALASDVWEETKSALLQGTEMRPADQGAE